MPRPVGVEKLAARLIDALVGVRAEIVALRLQQIGGQPLAAIAIEVAERGAQTRRGNPALHRCNHDASPRRLTARNGFPEEGVEQQVDQPRIAVECLLDLAEEGRADDAAATPDLRDAAVVELPVIAGGGG